MSQGAGAGESASVNEDDNENDNPTGAKKSSNNPLKENTGKPSISEKPKEYEAVNGVKTSKELGMDSSTKNNEVSSVRNYKKSKKYISDNVNVPEFILNLLMVLYLLILKGQTQNFVFSGTDENSNFYIERARGITNDEQFKEIRTKEDAVSWVTGSYVDAAVDGWDMFCKKDRVGLRQPAYTWARQLDVDLKDSWGCEQGDADIARAKTTDYKVSGKSDTYILKQDCNPYSEHTEVDTNTPYYLKIQKVYIDLILNALMNKLSEDINAGNDFQPYIFTEQDYIESHYYNTTTFQSKSSIPRFLFMLCMEEVSTCRHQLAEVFEDFSLANEISYIVEICENIKRTAPPGKEYPLIPTGEDAEITTCEIDFGSSLQFSIPKLSSQCCFNYRNGMWQSFLFKLHQEEEYVLEFAVLASFPYESLQVDYTKLMCTLQTLDAKEFLKDRVKDWMEMPYIGQADDDTIQSIEKWTNIRIEGEEKNINSKNSHRVNRAIIFNTFFDFYEKEIYAMHLLEETDFGLWLPTSYYHISDYMIPPDEDLRFGMILGMLITFIICITTIDESIFVLNKNPYKLKAQKDNSKDPETLQRLSIPEAGTGTIPAFVRLLDGLWSFSYSHSKNESYDLKNMQNEVKVKSTMTRGQSIAILKKRLSKRFGWKKRRSFYIRLLLSCILTVAIGVWYHIRIQKYIQSALYARNPLEKTDVNNLTKSEIEILTGGIACGCDQNKNHFCKNCQGPCSSFELMMIILYVFYIKLIIDEGSEIWRNGLKKYVKDAWNVFDVGLIFLLTLFFIFASNTITLLRAFLVSDNISMATYLNDNMPQLDDHRIFLYTTLGQPVTIIMGFLLFLTSCRVLKFLQLFPIINVPWRTFVKSFVEVGAFLFVLTIFIFSFSLLFMFNFGGNMKEFSGPLNSITTLLEGLFGEMDPAMFNTDPRYREFGLLLLSGYFLVTVIVSLNMVIAILLDHYTEEMDSADGRVFSDNLVRQAKGLHKILKSVVCGDSVEEDKSNTELSSKNPRIIDENNFDRNANDDKDDSDDSCSDSNECSNDFDSEDKKHYIKKSNSTGHILGSNSKCQKDKKQNLFVSGDGIYYERIPFTKNNTADISRKPTLKGKMVRYSKLRKDRRNEKLSLQNKLGRGSISDDLIMSKRDNLEKDINI